MWIKLIITIVTLFLLFDEYFKVIEKVRKKNRRKLVLSVLAVLSIFSLVDVIIEVNEGNDLVEKANKIIIKSDTLISNSNTIITDLKVNIKSVEESNNSIIAIDSVLKSVRDTVSSQVEIIKETASKSAELVRLEEKKFKADEAKIDIFTNEIRLVSNVLDPSFVDLSYDYRNIGKRYACNIKFSTVFLLYNKVLKDFYIDNIQNTFVTGDLSKNSIGGFKRKLKWKKEIIKTGNYSLLLFVKCQYQDVITKNKITYKGHFMAMDLKELTTNFGVIVDYKFAKDINKVLINNDLEEFLIDVNSLK